MDSILRALDDDLYRSEKECFIFLTTNLRPVCEPDNFYQTLSQEDVIRTLSIPLLTEATYAINRFDLLQRIFSMSKKQAMDTVMVPHLSLIPQWKLAVYMLYENLTDFEVRAIYFANQHIVGKVPDHPKFLDFIFTLHTKYAFSTSAIRFLLTRMLSLLRREDLKKTLTNTWP
ncbi:v-FLIP-like protein [Saguinine gammaherpesvirus 1]|uniref:V-FLIP-like protein n=1 Tax=Saguinine gammaherpesvirus 1 TaxID=2169901 RepID=A0A9Q8QXU5_9GAMA|nr:v-FLIP-like protein [Saguinine gammaherpesvirus 1]